jgi:hypothetical protein
MLYGGQRPRLFAMYHPQGLSQDAIDPHPYEVSRRTDIQLHTVAGAVVA